MKTPTSKKITVLFLLFLVFSLPIASALEISNVQSTQVTTNAALISWQTDEPADSFLSYGPTPQTLQTKGDANLLTDHALAINGLEQNTTYVYRVESSGIQDDNAGEFYEFTTLPPDKIPPPINVEIPAIFKGNRISISGTTEEQTKLSLFINNNLQAQTTTPIIPPSSTEANLSSTLASFSFPEIILTENVPSSILITAVDNNGNNASFQTQTTPDAQRPRITLQNGTDFTPEHTFHLQGNISEPISGQITVNNRSVAQITGTIIDEELSLSEGNNLIEVTVNDSAGWENSQTLTILSDTKPPQVSFKLVSGTEYYQGKAKTDIVGKTKPGADVLLFIYQARIDEYRADFSRANAKVTADEEGNFEFKDVSFPPSILSRLDNLKPREVPSGLQDILISPLDQITRDARQSFHIYIIAEDDHGRSATAPRQNINVNTCFSSNTGFDIIPLDRKSVV